MKKLSREFIKAISFLLAAFIIVQFVIIPTIYSNARLLAQATSSRIQKENVYKISPSGDFPGVFKFQYEFGKLPVSKEAYFDVPIIPFDKNKAGNFNIDSNASSIRDAWGYPIRENAYMKKSGTSDKKKTSFDFFKIEKALAYDEDPNNSSIYNCREDLSVTGYFKAYFEDVELNTGVGYDDETYGEGRRAEACQVLQDISEMIMLDNTDVTPDILFMANPGMPPGALAAASSYFGYYSVGPDNGSLHKHIISRVDPTPGEGNFDAFIMTGFNGINWDVDSSLNSSTYDFYTVMYHEVMHILGFFGYYSPIAPTPQGNGTFTHFSYRDSSLQSPFVNPLTNLVNFPFGAPSPWFITNDVVYRGVKNIVNAVPDSVRPVYSPTFWQQGSSLSHFDMNRAPGQTYVMHPSIGTNTERNVNEHEKEVLCHLGYQVEEIEECDGITPHASDDLISDEVSCVNFLGNDQSFSGGVVALDTFNILQLQTGDVINYFSGFNCTGTVLPTHNDSKSFFIYLSNNPGTRLIKYTVSDSISNRISFHAYIFNEPIYDFCDGIESENYICNGGFELGTLLEPVSVWYGQIAFICPSNIVPWCNFTGSTDIYDRGLNFLNPWVGYGPNNTHNGSNNDRYFGGMCSKYGGYSPGDIMVCESAFARTKATLVDNTMYKLSFYYIVNPEHNPEDIGNSLLKIFFTSQQPPVLNNSHYVPVAGDMGYEIVLPERVDGPSENLVQSDWSYLEQNIFLPDAVVDYEYVVFDTYNEIIGESSNNAVTVGIFFDDIKLQTIDLSKISGMIYYDQDQDGTKDLNEVGISGIPVAIYEQGEDTPLQTLLTEDIPNLGKYEFNNLPDGTYYIALIDENVYPTITQPGISSDPFLTYSHMYTLPINGGQTIADNDFGVLLNVTNSGPVDIQIKKTLIDSTLSLFDRFITWRIIIQNIGTNPATNILIKEIVPPGLIYHSNATPNPNTYDSSVHILNIPQLSAGGQTYIDITMKVPNSSKVCGLKTNIAVLHDLDQIDTNPSNNQDQASINLPKCKITVTPELETG